jgi:hypothetical protein
MIHHSVDNLAAMLKRLTILSLIVTFLAPSAGTAFAAGSPSQPTPAQIQAALARVKRSHNLWATVNICNPPDPKHRNTLGIRGQMPALGFASRLVMDIQVEYWSVADKRFRIVPGVRAVVDLGRFTFGLHQKGATFTFMPPVGLLRGLVVFEWKLRNRVIGRLTRHTSGGHKHVDYADPRGYSRWTCTIR